MFFGFKRYGLLVMHLDTNISLDFLCDYKTRVLYHSVDFRNIVATYITMNATPWMEKVLKNHILKKRCSHLPTRPAICMLRKSSTNMEKRALHCSRKFRGEKSAAWRFTVNDPRYCLYKTRFTKPLKWRDVNNFY